jgi:hypothetical protein
MEERRATRRFFANNVSPTLTACEVNYFFGFSTGVKIANASANNRAATAAVLGAI